MANPYDARYFSRCFQPSYSRDEAWLTHFGRMADWIVSALEPTTFLDAGCAMGLLVEALRDRGVEAYGLDISEHALANVREDIAPYCALASILDPLERRYDAIACIEVLEHLDPEYERAALDNFCDHTDVLIFSSTPVDFTEATHLNVQPAEHWATAFATRGFFRDFDLDASVSLPWTAVFRREPAAALVHLVAGYERRLWHLTQDAQGARGALDGLRAEVEQEAAARAAEAEERAAAESGHADELHEAQTRATTAVNELERLQHTRTFRYTSRPREVYAHARLVARRRYARRLGMVFADDIHSELTFEECLRLAELGRGKQALEIGSWFGRSAIALASTAQHVVAIDPHMGGPPGQEDTLTPMLANLKRYRVEDRVEVIQGTSYDVLPTLGRTFDLAFIDANHILEAVQQDLEVVRPCVRPGGHIAFHDYGVAGHCHYGNWDRFGVTEVADALAAEVGSAVELVETLAVVRLPA